MFRNMSRRRKTEFKQAWAQSSNFALDSPLLLWLQSTCGVPMTLMGYGTHDTVCSNSINVFIAVIY